ncbi:Putative Thioredoxin [Rhizopus microsporus]|nr:Putative Thioredoxin [Rhizopus microsporus]
MNSLRPLTTSGRQLLRSFHAATPRFTGKTIEGDKSTFDSLVRKADHPVIVDFYADWCGPCRIIGPALSKAVAANPQVTLVKINVDNCEDIAKEFNIAALPTVTAFHNGKVVDQFVGAMVKQVNGFVEKHANLAKK